MPRKSKSENPVAFDNLYFLVPEFRDFNRTTFLDRVEQLTGEDIELYIGRAFRSGNPMEFDPYLIDTISRTLRPATCEAFFRTHPELIFTRRDYYLSKVFQFTYAAFRYGNLELSPGVHVRLETVLRDILDDHLPRLYEIFSIEIFFWWTREYSSNPQALLDGLRLASLLVEAPFKVPIAPIGSRLREVYEHAGLGWKEIETVTEISRRRLYEIAYDGAEPSAQKRPKLEKFLSGFPKY